MHITEIYRYPLKSAKGQSLDQAQISADGISGDRVWMVVDDDGDQITARECPAMLQITVEKGYLNFPKTDPITLPTDGVDRKARLFSNDLIVSGTSQEISKWLTQALDKPAHLVAASPKTKRSYGARNYAGFGDLAPILLTGTASLERLNDLAPIDIEMDRFRPNIVVQTDLPFVEDHWQTLRVGDVFFDVIEPCVRCNFTYLNPETGQRDITCEPLRSLSAFHANEEGGICFGVYAVPRGVGGIMRGDRVTVTAKTQRRFQKTGSPFEPLQGRRALRITSISSAAKNAVHVEMAFDDGQPTQVIAGQFVVLHIGLPNGEEITRCYTVTQIRNEGRTLRISVRHEPGGIISGWLNISARRGYSLWTSGVFGDLTLPDRAALLLSAGSGITPFLAMAPHLPEGSHHLHYERDTASVIGKAEVAQSAGFQLMLTPVTGRISLDHLPACNLQNIDARVCGPAGFIETAKQILRTGGMPEANIKVETFAVPPQIEGGTKEFEIRINDIAISASQNDTILNSLRRNGLKVASACEVGACGTCRLRLISGSVKAMREADQEGFVLSCCSYPRSDLILDVSDT